MIQNAAAGLGAMVRLADLGFTLFRSHKRVSGRMTHLAKIAFPQVHDAFGSFHDHRTIWEAGHECDVM